MQKVIVQVDLYTKIILTLIAVLLAGLLAKPYTTPKPARAGWETVTVDNRFDNPVPVVVTNLPQPVGDAILNLSHFPIAVIDWKERGEYLEYVRKILRERGITIEESEKEVHRGVKSGS